MRLERGVCGAMKKTHESQIDSEKISLHPANTWKYVAMTLAFGAISYLSLVFVYNAFSQRSLFIDMGIFPAGVFVRLSVLLLAYFALDGLRFYYILKTLGINMEYSYILKMVFINIFVSAITPLATGGGFAQIYFLSKKGVSIGDATAATTIRTSLPIAFFVIATPIILIVDSSFMKVLPFKNTQALMLTGSGIFIAIAGMAMGIVRNPRSAKKAILRLLWLLKSKRLISIEKVKSASKIFKEIDSFVKSVRVFISAKKKDISLSILFTLVFLAALFMFPVVLIQGLGHNVSAIAIMALQTLITFVMYFAPTPGATGVAEGGFSIIFSRFVDKDKIVTVTFVWRIFTIYIGMLMGMVLFYREIFKISRARKEKTARQ